MAVKSVALVAYNTKKKELVDWVADNLHQPKKPDFSDYNPDRSVSA
jgi:methylglyoxal synthase